MEMKSLRRPKVIIPVGILLAVILIAGVFWRNRAKGQIQEITLKKTDLVRTIYALGTVQAEKTFSLRIGIAANIRKLYVREGQFVTARTKLVEFDQVPVMTAPFAGVVTTILFKEGESVFPQNPVLTITDLHHRYISASLDERAAVQASIGQRVRIAYDGLPGSFYFGKVRSIYPAEGQFIILIDSNDMPREILPGMSADLAIEAGTRKGVFVVPIAAVADGKITVWRAGKKTSIPIQLGQTQDEVVEVISSELRESDVIRTKK
jgi:membrane fusion protein, macrolide-specific efflux system